MHTCKNIGCNNVLALNQSADFCPRCLVVIPTGQISPNTDYFPERRKPPTRLQREGESSGGDNDYWIAKVTHPKRLVAYEAECEDLIEMFQMTFQEGEAFKALWRNGMLRLGLGKPGDTELRNAEKVSHFGNRMVAMVTRTLESENLD